jgi:MSHA pilin protein MshC
MNQKGFTLIELVMIIVLIGIVAAFAAPRLGNITSANAGSFADKLRADLRYAQNLSMTGNQRYRMYLNAAPAPASGYAVVNDANADGWGTTGAGEHALDPAGSGSLRVTLNAGDFTGITAGAPANGAGGFVEFNSLGSPTVGGITTIRVYANGVAVGNDIIISAQTGAVN